LQSCNARTIETQTNAGLLPTLLHVFAHNLRTESILFEDAGATSHSPPGAGFRPATADDAVVLRDLELDQRAGWAATLDGAIAGAGGLLCHYNRPYGDIYMAIAEPFRQRGLGSYLVQELKAECRKSGSVPAARCNVDNLASRRTLQKAGFIPCGALIAGDIRSRGD
jgi:GNAT superfamily N-acetyltransferase